MKISYTSLFKYSLSLLCGLLLCGLGSQQAKAQGARDGAMEIRIHFDQYYADCGSGELSNEDFVTEIRLRDYPDVDGASWSSSGVNAWTGPYVFGGGCPGYVEGTDYNATFTYGARTTLGPAASPAGLQMGFMGWEDDCFGCAGGSICFSTCSGPDGRTTYEPSCPCSCDCLLLGGDDNHSDREQLGTNYYPFRDGPPNAFTYKGIAYSGDAGYSDLSGFGGTHYGGTYSTFWTPPCPDTFWADRPLICTPGYVTLQSGGAVFGGTYRWYKEPAGGGTPTFIQETADSFFTTYVDRTTTFRVFTKNPVSPSAPAGTQTESWSYRNYTIFLDRPNITSIVPTNPLCADSASGSIVINATALIPPIDYTIDNGATWYPTNTFTGLTAGVYLVKVRNSVCEVPDFGLPITLMDPPVLSTNISRVDSVSCNGNADGSISMTTSGGTGPYTYIWNNGATTEDNVGLIAGSYNVLITDRNGCTNNNAANVYEPNPLTASITFDSVSCAGAADAQAFVTVNGGTPPYNYLWSNGVTNDTANGLHGGLYTCVVMDARNCRAVLSANIFEAAPIQLRLSKTDLSCFGANDGSITVDTSALGGIPTYHYNWSPAGPDAPVNSGLAAGTYSVTLTDAAGCTAHGTITLNQPDSLKVNPIIFDVRCNGHQNGRIDINVSGGTTPYTYNWSGPASFSSSNQNIDSLSGGAYNLTVTDAHGCTFLVTYNVNEPAALSTVMSGTNVNCFGAATGSATVNISGGTLPYNILWSTFGTTSTISSISAGNYTVIVTDDNGCVKTDRITITEAPEIVLQNIAVVNVLCPGAKTGAISFSVRGGSPGYHYAWSGGVSGTNSVSSLAAGHYTVTVSDDSGCFVIHDFDITQPPAFITGITGNNPTCNGNATGFAVISVSGGTLPYTYNWSTTPAQTGLMAINLAGGTYYVTVTDYNGCTVNDTVNIVPPPAITVSTTPFAVRCFAGNDGRVVVAGNGGTRPYRYTLNGILQTDSIFTGLTSGNYIIVVEDNNACIGSTTFSIAEPTKFSLHPSASPHVIPRGMTTQLNANIDSPQPIIRINWSAEPVDTLDYSGCADPRNCPTPTAHPSQTTVYTVEAINIDTCSLFDTVKVIVLQDKAVFIPTAFSPNGDGKNETFDFQILGAQHVEVNIFDRWGERLYTNSNQQNGAGQGWDGTNKGHQLPTDTYVYQFNVTYYDGTTDVLSGSVTLIR
jgi:gliding motility-associated-like protein